MKYPKNWHDLPSDLAEFVIDGAELEYCPYESSRVEAKENLINDPINDPNWQNVQNYYFSCLWGDTLFLVTENLIKQLEYRIENLKNFLAKA